MKKRQIIQPILWTERPTGAVMGTGSLWPYQTRIRVPNVALKLQGKMGILRQNILSFFFFLAFWRNLDGEKTLVQVVSRKYKTMFINFNFILNSGYISSCGSSPLWLQHKIGPLKNNTVREGKSLWAEMVPSRKNKKKYS